MLNSEVYSQKRGLDFFVAGGVLSPEARCYVCRTADEELFNLVLAGHYCYIFAPRGMGKSSLVSHIIPRLQQQNVKTATIDLSGFGLEARSEQCYLVLIKRWKFQLNLSIEADTWWQAQAPLEASQRFKNFLREVVLAEVEEPIVIFIDGLTDSSLKLEFVDGFLAAIRHIYEARSTDPVYERVTFVILGEAVLDELVKYRKQNPFDIGQKIDLAEFSLGEAQVLRKGLIATCSEQGETIFARIYYWTQGHPYLTQKLCLAVVKMWDGHWNDERVDGLVERLFRSTPTDPYIQFVEDSIKISPYRRRLLALYRQVYKGKNIAEDKNSLNQSRLRLLGVVNTESGALRVRNQVFRLIFDLDWIKTNTPINWFRYSLVILALLMVLLFGVVSFAMEQQRQTATEAQTLIDNFKNTTSPVERLTSLAKLFNLSGYQDQACELFYQELTPAEQMAMFDLADPMSVGQELITVVRGVYTNPSLKNDRQNNALLRAMAQPLRQLESSQSLRSIELELEITRWLKGREDYYLQGQYQQAIDAYNVAINMNSKNPGPYFDRGLAYAAAGRYGEALADFTTVLRLDENWRERLQQVLITETQLYSALWAVDKDFPSLVALVPTPTNTPTTTPTTTPTPTPSPFPTPTDTPFLPTATATSTPVATPTATQTSTLAVLPTATPTVTTTPTPGIPTGSLKLQHPISVNDPSYGPTTFEWQWTGPLPPEYGFEVRVWRQGVANHYGVHNAVLDNQNGNIQRTGDNTYRLDTDIKDAVGVKGQSGEYLWTVALVQISPNYVDLGLEAEPAPLRFEAGGSGGGGKDKDGGSGGGGGVGID